MKTRLFCGLALVMTLVAPKAFAAAKFVIDVQDKAGVGFNDTTPATPVGGNTGKTVGEQRLIAFQAAADVWGRVLDSPVPIVVEASFAPLECMDHMAVLGQCGPYSVSNSSSLPTKDAYPLALANKIVGKDMFPSDADIAAEFNGALYECIGVDWYYGLDGNAGAHQANLMTTVVHELTHGLGFTDGLDPTTGSFSRAPSVFANYVLDNKSGKHFPEMTNTERKTALTDIRGLVWDGKRTDAVAAKFLAKGMPTLQVSPAPSGLSGVLGEANFGRYVADGGAISGSIAMGTFNSTCDSVTGSFSGKIALIISATDCASLSATARVEPAGALALLFAYNEDASPPPQALEFRNSDIARFNVTIPTVAVTLDDANLLKSATSATVTLSADQNRLVGADSAGHAHLFASDPIQPGSTGPHWDPIVRPNLVMEPVDLPNPVMYLDMERALLWDIGWTGDCGNGTPDGQEECDNGTANSDFFPDACRLDCTKAKCGDGVVDTGEKCDPGTPGKRGDPNCDATCTPISGTGTGGSTTIGRGGASGTGGRGSGGVVGSGGTAGKVGSGGATASGSGGTTGGKGGAPGTGGSNPTGGVVSGSGGAAGEGQGGSQTGSGGRTHHSTGGTTHAVETSSGCHCSTGRGEVHPGLQTMAVGLGLLFWLRRRKKSAR